MLSCFLRDLSLWRVSQEQPEAQVQADGGRAPEGAWEMTEIIDAAWTRSRPFFCWSFCAFCATQNCHCFLAYSLKISLASADLSGISVYSSLFQNCILIPCHVVCHFGSQVDHPPLAGEAPRMAGRGLPRRPSSRSKNPAERMVERQKDGLSGWIPTDVNDFHSLWHVVDSFWTQIWEWV